MKINVFNVTHGFCSLLTADNNNIMMFDCGHNEINGFRPSAYLKRIGCTGIECLFISNFDEDHVSDLQNILINYRVDVIYCNRSISPDTVESIKLQTGPLSPSISTMIECIREYSNPIYHHPDFPGITFHNFYNKYPEFVDTNNLSLVSFIYYNGLCFLYPGDMEIIGWKSLLRDRDFVNNLRNVNIFVASHHGRENGYCLDVFKYCNPDIFIISDKNIIYSSQENVYAKHAKGIKWENGDKRYVLTTRTDGNIEIFFSDNNYYVTTGM